MNTVPGRIKYKKATFPLIAKTMTGIITFLASGFNYILV